MVYAAGIQSNQPVLGRVIRHKFDYGVILLCDERFAYDRQRSSLSKWIKPLVQVHRGFGETNSVISQFFRRASSKPEWNRKKIASNRKTPTSEKDEHQQDPTASESYSSVAMPPPPRPSNSSTKSSHPAQLLLRRSVRQQRK